ncbi:unnamed protein product [Penicillium nalgiovense]|uniref:Secreted peptide n=1 Tax=Penicillium nalgiovense TaxID=60175 RepID=A0A9W4HPX5_PENNA|nr:unnamed protein product [Penicillium nalgiovense]CAG8110119.1 unnamed protein product [Penicillium nalgiovense]CAG8114521.1 unnamed protein product [Penicillium nalgiovense]CAG8124864.1 unnamed protein product [Penicillium nalgiovense]CAG8137129.1 unnamed protein product [Penicillium nalgiovense]
MRRVALFFVALHLRLCSRAIAVCLLLIRLEERQDCLGGDGSCTIITIPICIIYIIFPYVPHRSKPQAQERQSTILRTFV